MKHIIYSFSLILFVQERPQIYWNYHHHKPTTAALYTPDTTTKSKTMLKKPIKPNQNTPHIPTSPPKKKKKTINGAIGANHNATATTAPHRFPPHWIANIHTITHTKQNPPLEPRLRRNPRQNNPCRSAKTYHRFATISTTNPPQTHLIFTHKQNKYPPMQDPPPPQDLTPQYSPPQPWRDQPPPSPWASHYKRPSTPLVMTFHVTGHDPPCHVDPRERPSPDPSNPHRTHWWPGLGVTRRWWPTVAWGRAKGEGESEREREREMLETKLREWESQEQMREKKNKIKYLFLQLSYSVILHVELHRSIIAIFFAIVYIYNFRC